MNVELQFLGKSLTVYRGMDGVKPIHLKVGDKIDLSEAKATKLMADYPDDFKRTSGAREEDPPEEEEKPEPPTPAKREPKEEAVIETPLERSERTGKASGKKPQKNKAITPKRNKAFVPTNKRK